MAVDFGVPGALDGGLSTALERRGHDLTSPLWTARLVLDDPEAIIQAHLDYLRAGARFLITAAYQASTSGFMALGAGTEEAARAIARTTELAREAIGRFADEDLHGALNARVAASVGPYGAILADGSEYDGHYALGRGDLVAFHAERLAILESTKPDCYAIETIPTAAEADAIGAALAAIGSQTPAWLCFTCRSGTETHGGDSIERAIAVAAAVEQVGAVGVNCTAPGHVDELLVRIARATTLPRVVYPNRGQAWDGEQRQWQGDPQLFSPERVARWRVRGATIIGGCCGVGPDEIAELVPLVG
jgi:homocysteine S-methyltransferase